MTDQPTAGVALKPFADIYDKAFTGLSDGVEVRLDASFALQDAIGRARGARYEHEPISLTVGDFHAAKTALRTPASGAVEAARREKAIEAIQAFYLIDWNRMDAEELADAVLAALTSEPQPVSDHYKLGAESGAGWDCPRCSGDCAGANPPVLDCPLINAEPQPLQGGEVTRSILDLATKGADKAGCDGWRAQEMCRQIVALLSAGRGEEGVADA